METARCRAFLAAAETGSFSRAAEMLRYTPSGVNQLVTALEKEIGFSLFSRSISFRISTIPAGSRPLIGSSKIRNSGSCMSDRAIPRRCFMPREKFLNFLSLAS